MYHILCIHSTVDGYLDCYHVLTIKNNTGIHREISSVLRDHLEGWDREGGRETQEGGDMGIYVYI